MRRIHRAHIPTYSEVQSTSNNAGPSNLFLRASPLDVPPNPWRTARGTRKRYDGSCALIECLPKKWFRDAYPVAHPQEIARGSRPGLWFLQTPWRLEEKKRHVHPACHRSGDSSRRRELAQADYSTRWSCGEDCPMQSKRAQLWN